jgi:hypothetical protein
MLRNWMKTIAVTLIVLPEPFTTLIGILILAVLMAIPRHKSLKKFGDLEVLIKRSIQRQEKARPVFRHYLSQETAANSTQSESWFDNRRVSEQVLHHTLKTSFPQYEARTDLVKNGPVQTDWRDSEPGVVHHTLKQGLVPAGSGSLN